MALHLLILKLNNNIYPRHFALHKKVSTLCLGGVFLNTSQRQTAKQSHHTLVFINTSKLTLTTSMFTTKIYLFVLTFFEFSSRIARPVMAPVHSGSKLRARSKANLWWNKHDNITVTYRWCIKIVDQSWVCKLHFWPAKGPSHHKYCLSMFVFVLFVFCFFNGEMMQLSHILL